MANESAPTQCNQTSAVQLRRDIYAFLPWLHLLRAVTIAMRPRMLVLGLIGWGAVHWGIVATAACFPSAFWKPGIDDVSVTTLAVKTMPVLPKWLSESWPFMSLLSPLRAIFGTHASWSSVAAAWTLLLWALFVWGIVGGAMSRLAAFQFARHERKGVRYALKFSARQCLSYLIAPLLPLTGVACLAGVSAVVGFLVNLEEAYGFGVLTILMPICLGLSYLMTLMLIGLGLGWPLMIAAISTEDSDGFDGLCRSFGFLWDRPWHIAGLMTLCGGLFFVGNQAVTVFCDLATYLMSWSANLCDVVPGSKCGNTTARLWQQVGALPVQAFVPSFFFTASTVVYFLVRQSDDGTPLTDVVDVRDHELVRKKPALESTVQPATEATAASSSDSSTHSS